jgi:hypothetical protein
MANRIVSSSFQKQWWSCSRMSSHNHLKAQEEKRQLQGPAAQAWEPVQAYKTELE